MRRYHLVPAALMLVFALFACGKDPKEKPAAPHGLAMNCFCADTNLGSHPCWVLPNDITGTVGLDYHGLDSATQQMFDLFSWQSFIALNWPANADGTPNTKDSIGDVTGPRVWDYYTDPIDLFGLPASNVAGFPSGVPRGVKILRMMAKNAHVEDSILSFIQPTGFPLVDRNLNFVLYEIKMNPDEVKYITSNNLQTAEGQVGKTISFPAGMLGTNTVGAIEIKAAWRIMRPDRGDDTSKFYTESAIISIPAANVINGKPLVVKAQVGLVGLHILHKVTNGQGWIWTTFEHVDNVPDAPFGPNPTYSDSTHYSFFDPIGLFQLPLNTPPPVISGDKGLYKWDTVQPYAKRYATDTTHGTQLVRGFPIYYETQEINKVWRDKLKGTVWANYQLIGSQWQASISNDPPVVKVSVPPYLANPVMESFIAGNSTCIGCHNGAVDAAKQPSDFSFLLGLATKSQLNVAHIPIR